MIPPNTRIWIAAGVTDMRCVQFVGREGQTVLEKDPFSGNMFAFRRKRGDSLKLMVVRWPPLPALEAS